MDAEVVIKQGVAEVKIGTLIVDGKTLSRAFFNQIREASLDEMTSGKRLGYVVNKRGYPAKRYATLLLCDGNLRMWRHNYNTLLEGLEQIYLG